MMRYIIIITLILASCKGQDAANIVHVPGVDSTRISTSKETITDSVDNFKPSAFWSFEMGCDSLFNPVIRGLKETNSGLITKLEKLENKITLTADAPTRTRTITREVTDTIYISKPNPINQAYQEQANEMRKVAKRYEIKAQANKKMLNRSLIANAILLVLLVIFGYIALKF